MTKIADIYRWLCETYPLELQLGFDNSGFQLGRLEAEVSKALLALDVTPEVVKEAVDMGAELIVSHHPLIFHPLKRIDDEKLLTLAENRIAVISMHTNLDIAPGGVNDVLMELLGAQVMEGLDDDGCGRVGLLPEPEALESFLSRCKALLGTAGLRYHDAGRPVQRLGVMGGAGGDALEAAWRKGCDTYLTADIKHHQFLQAAELGINYIDADHFCTEAPVMPRLMEELRAAFPQVAFTLSTQCRQPLAFF